MSLMEKLKKNSTIKDSAVLSKSKFFNNKDVVTTSVPMINVAFSGDLNGGFTPGLTMWAGPSKHFKTAFSLLMAKAYMDKYPDAVLLFYDSEFGTPIKYFETFNIDMERVLHTPLTDIEQLKFDIMQQFQEVNRGDHLIIVLDSIGNLASKKEVEDALDGKSVADMSRAKQVKSLFRMVTPHLTLKDIPMVVVNHTYKEIRMFPKDIVGGGTGSYYSADNIYILGRQQEKDGTEIMGYNFIINVEKSRYVKEKSKIPINVAFEGGINKYSGLLDIALEGNFAAKPSNGWYAKVNQETGEIGDKVRYTATQTDEFMGSILKDKRFQEYVRKMRSLMAALWEKILFWKKPMQNETLYKEGVDYSFNPVEDSELMSIKILQGDFKDIVYCYGGVEVVEEGEGARLKFDYIIVDSGDYQVEELTINESFSTMLGDILVGMITVEGTNDTPRNDDSEESDLL